MDTLDAEVYRDALMSSSDIGVCVVDYEGTFLGMNQMYLDIYGYEKEELIGQSITMVLPHSTQITGLEYHKKWFRGEVESQPLATWSVVSRDGDEYQVLVESFIVDTDVPVEDRKAVVFVRNVTSVNEIRTGLSMFRAALNSAHEGMVFMGDLRGDEKWPTIRNVNPAMCELLEYERDDIVGSGYDMFFGAETNHSSIEDLKNAILRQESRTLDVALHTSAGHRLWIEVSIAPVFNDEGVLIGHIMLHRDTTRRTMLTTEMMQVDRMASFGATAASIAHEINNPLSYCIQNLEYLNDIWSGLKGRRIPGVSESTIRDMVEAIEELGEGMEAIRDIATDLKTFSRNSPEDSFESVDIVQVIEGASRMAAHHIQRTARFEQVFPDIVPAVEGDQGQIGQVIINLLINASDAVSAAGVDGEISIQVSHMRRVSDDPSLVHDEYVSIEVKDNGIGIPRAKLSYVFEPFFTTKERGKGTGLGLSICKQIVEAHRGRIFVKDTGPSGTTIVVEFPIIEGSYSTDLLEDTQTYDEVISKLPRVAIIDDEKNIVNATRRMLSDMYEITTYTEATAALADIRKGASFDVILCDLAMPTMTGMEFYASLEVMDHPVRDNIIFVTAGTFTPQSSEFISNTTNFTMFKPVNAIRLKATIKRVIEGLS